MQSLHTTAKLSNHYKASKPLQGQHNHCKAKTIAGPKQPLQSQNHCKTSKPLHGQNHCQIGRGRRGAGGWESENSPPTPSMRQNSHTSALVLFLEALTTLYFRGDPDDPCLGLPSTLEHLMLIDKYHTLIPSLHQLIATAILPCNNLKTLGTTVKVNGKSYDTISKMGLPAYHKIVGVSTVANEAVFRQSSSHGSIGRGAVHYSATPAFQIRPVIKAQCSNSPMPLAAEVVDYWKPDL